MIKIYCRFLVFILQFVLVLQALSQTNNWTGKVNTDYFNRQNWADTNINFANVTSTRLRIGQGSPHAAVLNGGNASNINYRPDRLNTLGGGTFTCNGAVYPNNNDSLNGTVVLNAPADLNIRNNAYIGNREAAFLTINGGSLTSKNAMFIGTNTNGSAIVSVAGGSLNAGSGGVNMDLNLAITNGSTAQLSITGGSVRILRNLVIGTGGSISISGIGLMQVAGNKVVQLQALVADGRLSTTPGKTLIIDYDGVNTSVFLSLNPNSMLREYGDSVVLNNGIIRARIEKRSGDILSLKYNGVEQLNQIGASRTGAYHDFQTSYGFETMNNCVFTVKTDAPDIVDVSLKRSYNPQTGQVTPADADIHYVLNRGDTGLYSYSILEHKPAYPAFDLGSWRMVEWIAQNGTDYLCERIYVDSLRNWQMPSVYDFNNASATGIAEIAKLNTGVRAGKFDGKYEYTAAFWETPVWGHASSVNHIGTWMVLSSPEFMNGGPTHQDLNAAAGINHMLLNGLHYGDKSFVIQQGEQWSKIYGPYLLYTTSKQTGDENWAAAKARAEQEKAKWPYTWLTNTPEYPLAAERGSISGKFIIKDMLKPEVTGANAWVGLTKISNADNEWQHEGKNYHYWVKTNADGEFKIPHVRPGTYSFFAYCNGAVGDYRLDGITVTAGKDSALGNISWTIPRNYGHLLWEIGAANRKSDEFRMGKFDYAEGFVERKFRDTFPNPVEYNVADQNWSTTIPFAHTKYPDPAFAPAGLWKWRINFVVPPGSPTTGNATLTIAYASNDHAQQWIYVNNENAVFTTYFPDNGDGNAFIRQANYAKYSYKQISIPMSRLVAGNNTITLAMPSNSGWVSHLMYDYLSLEVPVNSVLPVSMLSFKGTSTINGNLLNWTTTREVDHSYYVVEKSRDGIVFQSIGKIEQGRIEGNNTSYAFTDRAPFTHNYYRLKQVDADGAYRYSEIRFLKSLLPAILVYPNPATNEIVVHAGANKIRWVEVYNSAGMLVFKKTALNHSDFRLDIARLPRGVYNVKVYDGLSMQTLPVAKQ
ncbi:polysaccharide lyase family protein [Segetibacter sp. 3557_3]|uniref:polysaccharide lyase family protein n=1 Tax=Segetibacter sp. 3557_3 TaxID=2547429 RepID=UPI001404E0E8|nr:polysaccharide lyase family protein [Segetibacter sp. 3557_3]